MRTLLCLFVTALIATPALAYETNTVWWDMDQLPIQIALVRPGSEDLGEQGTEDAVLASLEQWADVGCTTLEYEYIGWVDETVYMDGIVHIGFIEEDSGMGDAAAATGIQVNPNEGTIVDVNILFNGDTFTWVTENSNLAINKLDTQAVMVHEFGHLFGLDHQPDMFEATMFFAYTSAAGGYISWDDKWGICELYPGGDEDECQVDEDCPDHPYQEYRCREIPEVGHNVCEEIYDELGGCCDVHWNNCLDGLCHTHIPGNEGYCSQFCEDAADCPTGWSCDPINYMCEDAGWCVSPEGSGQHCGDDYIPEGDDDDSAGDDDDDDTGDDDDDDGCQCDTTGKAASPAWLMMGVGLGWLAYRRRR